MKLTLRSSRNTGSVAQGFCLEIGLLGLVQSGRRHNTKSTSNAKTKSKKHGVGRENDHIRAKDSKVTKTLRPFDSWNWN